MHFFTFLARRLAESESEGEQVGAYVNCWIEQRSREAAEIRARELIADSSWTVESLKDHRIVTDADYSDDTDGREYYEQACLDGETLVFHTWPASGEGEAGQPGHEG